MVTGDANAAELARLDEVVARNDARDGSNDRWRAAEAVYDKAKLIRRLEGVDAALPLYGEVVERLTGCREPGPRALLISTMNTISVIHGQQGREGESRSVARALVDEHFDDAPAVAIGALVEGTLGLAKLLRAAGEVEAALELVNRVIDRYGQPGVPEYRFTAAAANCEAGEVLWKSGRLEESLQRFNGLIRELGDPAEPSLREPLAWALIGKACVLNDMDLPAERNAVCEQLIERFKGTEDPKIAEDVEWARMVLDEFPAPSRRRRRPWRR